MNPSFQKLNLLLGKLQSSLGSKQSTLTLTDQRAVEDNFSLDYIPEFTAQNLAQGILGQPQNTKGVTHCDIKVSMPAVPTSVFGTPPNVNDFLLSSGLKQTAADFPFTYVQSDDIVKDCSALTLWGYSGDKVGANSLLTKTHSAMFDCKISGELGKPCMFEFTGKGAIATTPANASYPSGMTLLSDSIPVIIKTTEMTVDDITLKILKFDVTIGNVIEMVKDASQDYGYVQSTIVGRSVKFTAQVLQEDLGTSENNSIKKMDDQTTGDFGITFGDSVYSISINSASGKCHITSVKQAAEAGLNVFDISGVFINNDLQILFYYVT